jgi:SAM-dependent methyltransferase
MKWVEQKVEQLDLKGKNVLEVGSRNVNGSVRPLFESESYVGVDMMAGDSVDIVGRADDLPFEDESFDVVVSTEMLEHDPFFWLSIPEMARVLKTDGYLLLTTRGIGFPYHEFPGDYWRFTEEAIRHLFAFAVLIELEITPDEFSGHPGWFGLARKEDLGALA